MEERDKEVIRHMYVRLGRTLEATKLLSYLYQEHVLSEEDMEKIKLKATSKKKAEKLLKILKKRKNGLKMLIKALLVTEIQAFLGHELLERVTWSQEDMENFKLELEGKVDPYQMLQANLTTLRQKNKQLTSKISEFELKVNILKAEKLVLEERSQDNSHTPLLIFGSQFFHKLRRSKKLNTHRDSEETIDDKLNEESDHRIDQSCQTNECLSDELPTYNIIYDDLGMNWTEADLGRRWSDSAYADRKRKHTGSRRRSLNDSISRSSASFKNAVLAVFGKRQEVAQNKADNSSDSGSDSCSHSTVLTELS